ncbi:MAG: hemin uptake protein HemP, partial [Gammaproteobacteria bacterium]|nr:hemin uptake protein HemP [Gammaproteobacteria bacterium]
MNDVSKQKGDETSSANAGVRSVTSIELLGPVKQLLIIHDGENYTLRIT